MLGLKLRALRKEKRMTLAQVSGETGFSVSFLSDIERGRTNPSLDSLDKLAAFYETPVDELMGAEPPKEMAMPAGFDEFLKETQVEADFVDLLLRVDHRARTKAKTPEDWRKYYYTLKAVMGR